MKVLDALNDAGRTIVIIKHEDNVARFAKRVADAPRHTESDQLPQRTEICGMSSTGSGLQREKVS
jgi:ABC-type lipoprotein export system ATPase subunit